MLNIPLEQHSLDDLLQTLETEETAKTTPVSITKTEFWQTLKQQKANEFVRDELEKDGCDFIECAFVFMALLGVPEESIDLVLCLMGMSRGNYDEPITATDEMIAKRLNSSRKTVANKRNILLSWMNSSTYSILEVHKREYNYQTQQYKPTQYKLLLVPYIATFVRDTRKKEFFKKPSPNILIATVEQEVETLVREIAKEIPEAKHTFRDSFNKPKQTSLPNTTGKGSLKHAFKHESENTDLPLQTRIKYAKRDALKMITQYLDLSFHAGIPFAGSIESFKAELDEVLKSYFNEESENDDMPYF